MRQLVMSDFGSMSVVDTEPVQELEPGEVAVSIEYCGVCGTDLHGFTGANGRRTPGQIMGHEAAGYVSRVGSAIDPRSIPIGAAVTFNPLLSCGDCPDCASGFQQRCEARRVIGVDAHLPGAFQDEVRVPASAIHRLPVGMSTKAGALVEPFAVGLHALRTAGQIADQEILVLGGGPIGQATAIAAIGTGARAVIVSEPRVERRAILERLGATTCPPEEVHRALAGSPPAIVIDAVGVDGSIATATSVLRPGGTLVLVGMGAPRLNVEAYPLTVGERSIRGSYCYTNQDFADAVNIVAGLGAGVGTLISAEIPISEAPNFFAGVAGGLDPQGKALIRHG